MIYIPEQTVREYLDSLDPFEPHTEPPNRDMFIILAIPSELLETSRLSAKDKIDAMFDHRWRNALGDDYDYWKSAIRYHAAGHTTDLLVDCYIISAVLHETDVMECLDSVMIDNWEISYNKLIEKN